MIQGTTPRPAPAKPAPRRPRLASLTALFALVLAAGCICPASSEELLETGYQTPRQTFESFQAFLATDLPNQEFRCFSAGFRQRQGISLLTYGEGRDELLASKPWIRYLAKAEISGEEVWSQRVHVIDAQIRGRTVRVKMVREDSYEISGGRDLLADGYCEWESVVTLDPAPGPRLHAAVTPDPSSIYGNLSEATRFVVERTWRIDDLWEADDAPSPPAP